jgi:type VI secretion system protein ImpE
MSTHELFDAGDLQGAIKAALEDVRLHPTDPPLRLLLGELLCLGGERERADRQLDTLGQQDPQLVVGTHAFRQLIRAEEARQQFFTSGRVPEFLGPPSEAMKLLLEASIRVRESAFGEAAALLARAEQQRPPVTGKCNGQAFQDLRDLDDQTSCIFEILTTAGRYFWVPIEQVASITFEAPARPRDLLWRQSRLVLRDGLDAEVFLPALYAGTQTEGDDRARLGRSTDWKGGDDAPTRGIGQRMFLVGDEARPILEIETLQMD